MNKIKKYKVGIDSETYAVSLVEEPAIESDFVALKKEEEEKHQVFLEKNERHMVYGAALIPDKDIYRNNGEQEFYISFTKESIEKMSQDFMKNYRQNEVTLDHEEMAKDITITESWLVEDSYRDKSNALGINVPNGTWMIGMKVNQIDVWERIKNGELNGFSVESMISLEEFSKQNDNNMNIETDEMNFWTKLKEVLREAFCASKEELAQTSGFTNVEDYEKEVEQIKAELEEQQPTVEEHQVDEPQPTVEEPQPKVEEPKVDEPQPTVEEPQKNEETARLEELLGNLRNELEALKTMNSGLEDKIKELSKEPSANPININAKPNVSDTYAAWREQLRNMIG